MTPEAQNKLLARSLLEEVVNTGRVARLPEFFAEDCRVAGATGNSIAWLREHLRAYHASHPDLVVRVDGQVAEGDMVVTWWTMRGTYAGASKGWASTRKPLVLRGVNIQKFRDGRIVEHFGGSNSLEVLLDLGLVQWAGDSGR